MLRLQRSTLPVGPDQTLIYRKQGSAFALPLRRRRGAAKRLSQPSPQLPSRRRSREPRRCRREKNQSADPPNREPDDRGEDRKPKTAKRRAQSIERRLFLAAARPFAFADMFFDERYARRKDGGKCEKETAKDGPKPAAMSSGDDGHGPAKREPYEVFAPAGLAERG